MSAAALPAPAVGPATGAVVVFVFGGPVLAIGDGLFAARHTAERVAGGPLASLRCWSDQLPARKGDVFWTAAADDFALAVAQGQVLVAHEDGRLELEPRPQVQPPTDNVLAFGGRS